MAEATGTRPSAPGHRSGNGGMAEATRPPAARDGSGNGPGTGNRYLFAFRGGLAH